MSSDELRLAIRQIHDNIAAVYTDSQTMRKRVVNFLEYLGELAKLPDDELVSRQEELYARLLEERDHVEGRELEKSTIINDIKTLGAKLRPQR